MSALRGVAGAIVVVAGCATPQRPTAASTVPATAAVDEVLAGRVDELRQRLGAVGARFEAVVARGFLAPHGHVTHPIALEAGACVTVVALASGTIRDLDAHVYAPDGDLVVEDVEVDAHPTVQLCATEARRVYHLVEAFEGQGAYAIALFRSDRGALEGIAHAMGGRPGVSTGAAGGGAAVERRVAALRDGIARRGFQAYGEPRRVDFAGAGTVTLPLQVTPDRCYTVAAFSDGEAAPASLQILDGDLEEIARDERGGGDPSAQFCPLADAPLSVRLTRGAGAGALVLHAFSADAAAIGGDGSLWLGVRRSVGDSLPLDAAWTRVRELLGQVAPSALAAPVQSHALTLEPGQVEQFDVPVDAAHCLFAVAGGAPRVQRVRLEALSGREGAVVPGVQRGGIAAVAQCGEGARTVSVRAFAEHGTGEVGVRVISAERAAWMRGADADAAATAFALGALAPTSLVTTATVAPGGVIALDVERTADRCASVAFAAGSSDVVELVMRRSDGTVAAQSDGVSSASLRRCGPEAERMHVEVRVTPSVAREVHGVWVAYEPMHAPAQ